MDSSKAVPLDNITTGPLVNIPTTSQFTDLKSALRSVTESMTVRFTDILVSAIHSINEITNKYYIQIPKMLMDLIGNMPLNLVRRYVDLKNVTLIFSNVPGGSQIHILDDCLLEMIVPFVPLVNGLGQLSVD